MTPDEFYERFVRDEDKQNRTSGAEIIIVCTNLTVAGNGNIPDDKDMLKAVGIDDTVSALLMTQVYGSTELIVGYHARKILTALDMVD
jgi:hypothetical protein